jgi:hypothetical protein
MRLSLTIPEAKRKYKALIEKAQATRRRQGGRHYYEKHHILPKSLGGTKAAENMVLLTLPEHFTAHKLLVDCYGPWPEKNKMISALWFLIHDRKKLRRKVKDVADAKRLHKYEKGTEENRARLRAKFATPEMRKIIDAMHAGRNTPASRAKRSSQMKERMSRPNVKKKLIKTLRAVWENPELKQAASETQKRVQQDPAIKEAKRQAQLRAWADPVKRAARIKKMRAVSKDPDTIRRRSEQNKSRWLVPGYREKQSAAMKVGQATARLDPVRTAKSAMQRSLAHLAHFQDPKAREALSEAVRQAWQDPEKRSVFVAARRKRAEAERKAA